MAEGDTSRRDPEQIRDEIRQTRAQMSKTIDELEDRLNPQRLKQEAVSTVRQQTVGRVEDFADDATRMVKGASMDVVDTIKENPLPAALVAIGLGWLFMEGRGESRSMRREMRRTRYGYDRDYGYGYGEYRPGMTGGRWQGDQEPGMTDRMRETAGEAQDKARQVASQAQDKARQVAYQAQDKAQELKEQAREQVSDLTDTAQEQAYRIRSGFENLMDENPLLVGAAAVALGAAIGMSLPSTPQEDQLLGEKRDQLMTQAQSAASETMDKVQQVADRAGTAAKEAAKDEAQKQNLSS